MRKTLSSKLIIFSLVIIFIIVFWGGKHIFASSGNKKPYNKYYTSVRVEDGDTIWTIADKYIEGFAVDKRDYVEEICKLNKLSDGKVQSGNYIIVSYYSQE